MKSLRHKLKLFDDTGMLAEVRRSLNIMVLAVLFGQVCFTVTMNTALTGLVKELGASDFIFSVLMAMPIVGNLTQLLSSYLLERTRKRRFLMLFFGLISRACWLPVGLAPFFFRLSQPVYALWIIVLFVTLNASTGAFMTSSFYSLAGDLVPMRIRGRYFSVRSRLSMIVGIAAGLGISAILDVMPGLPGYAVVFAIAAVFGMADIACFFLVSFPPMAEQEEKIGFFRSIGKVIKNKRFMRIALFVTAWSFSVNISAPFFNVYMLQHLKMTFTQITLFCTIASYVCSMLFVTRWGRMMDAFGNRPVMHLAMTVASFLPIIWLFTGPHNFYAIIVVQLMSGSIWPAIDLSIQNLYLGQAPERGRSIYIAVYFVITQVFGIALGYLTGGAVVEALAPVAAALGWRILGFEVTQYNMLFLLSMTLRALTAIFLIRLVTEPGAQSTSELIGGIRAGIIKGAANTRGRVGALTRGVARKLRTR